MNLFYKLTKNPNLKKNCLSKGGGEGGGVEEAAGVGVGGK